MAEHNALTELATAFSALAFGGIVGALNRALRAKPVPLKIALMEAIAAIGAGIAGGGITYSALANLTGANELFAAIAASSACSYFGDKVFRRIAEKLWGEENASDLE